MEKIQDKNMEKGYKWFLYFEILRALNCNLELVELNQWKYKTLQ